MDSYMKCLIYFGIMKFRKPFNLEKILNGIKLIVGEKQINKK